MYWYVYFSCSTILFVFVYYISIVFMSSFCLHSCQFCLHCLTTTPSFFCSQIIPSYAPIHFIYLTHPNSFHLPWPISFILLIIVYQFHFYRIWSYLFYNVLQPYFHHRLGNMILENYIYSLADIETYASKPNFANITSVMTPSVSYQVFIIFAYYQFYRYNRILIVRFFYEYLLCLNGINEFLYCLYSSLYNFWRCINTLS